MIKICIIKFGALGDVVRTLPILGAVKEKYPNSEITWITKKDARGIFEGNPCVEKVLTIPVNGVEDFEILYNFDTENEATELANKINAKEKFGFCSEGDFVTSFNSGAEYYLNTIFDDELKKSNRKTYQEMMFDIAELEWKKQEPKIFLSEEDRKYAEDFLRKNKLERKKILGVHIGAGSRWPSKVWHEENLKEFIEKAKKLGFEILLFGGPNEKEKHREIVCELNEKGIEVFQNNPENSVKEFAVLVNICDKIVCGDSFSLHIALALGKQTIGLFFCTAPWEVEGYGLLKTLISPKLLEIFPERCDIYDENLVKSISADEVLNKLNF